MSASIAWGLATAGVYWRLATPFIPMSPGARAAGLDSLFCCGGIHAAEIGTHYGEMPDPARLEADRRRASAICRADRGDRRFLGLARDAVFIDVSPSPGDSKA